MSRYKEKRARANIECYLNKFINLQCCTSYNKKQVLKKQYYLCARCINIL